VLEGYVNLMWRC